MNQLSMVSALGQMVMLGDTGEHAGKKVGPPNTWCMFQFLSYLLKAASKSGFCFLLTVAYLDANTPPQP